MRRIQPERRRARGQEGRKKKLSERLNLHPLVDIGGAYSYSFVYIWDFCKLKNAVSY